MASNEPFKKKKVEYNVDQSTVDKILKKRFSTEKKPKKFTWKGLMNAASILETNPFDPIRLQRIRDLMEGSDAEEKDYIDTFEDLEKGFYSGAQKLGYAIGDLATAGIDLTVGRLFDTNLNEKLTEVYEDNKLKEPEALTGKVVEVLTQYGVPGSAGLKITNRLRKLSLAQKAKAASVAAIGTTATNIASKSGVMATAFGITDFLATEPGRGNIVLKEEDTEGLFQREFENAVKTDDFDEEWEQVLFRICYIRPRLKMRVADISKFFSYLKDEILNEKQEIIGIAIANLLTQTSVTSVQSTDQGQAQPSSQSKNNDEETVTILRDFRNSYLEFYLV